MLAGDSSQCKVTLRKPFWCIGLPPLPQVFLKEMGIKITNALLVLERLTLFGSYTEVA